MAAAFDEDLTVARVRISNAFFVTTVELACTSLLAVEGFDNLVRLTVP
jgi:hypothetical protein